MAWRKEHILRQVNVITETLTMRQNAKCTAKLKALGIWTLEDGCDGELSGCVASTSGSKAKKGQDGLGLFAAMEPFEKHQVYMTMDRYTQA